MKYSFLMSVYWKEDPLFLDAAIQSMLQQSLPADEIYIVCDGPIGSRLESVLDKYQELFPSIFTINKQKENRGLASSLNVGLNSVKNEAILRMDSDDITLPDRAKKEIAKLEEGYDVVGGWITEFEGSPSHIVSLRTVPEKMDDIIKYCKKRDPMNHPTVAFRKQAIKKAGLYPDSWRAFEDYKLWYEVIKNNGQLYNIQEPLTNMRTGVGQFKRRGKTLNRYRRILRKEMRDDRFISFWAYWFLTPLMQIACFMPPKLLRIFYRIFLREKPQKRNPYLRGR